MKTRFLVVSQVLLQFGIINTIMNTLAEKIVNLGNTNKIHLKCDVFDGSFVDGIREPRLYSFVLNKLPGYKVFCEPETFHYKKKNKSVLKTTTFYLEDDKNEEFDFNQKTLTFTVQMIKN